MINLDAFKQQRKNARYRGIGFELTFEQWLTIWEASGRLSQRGRGRGLYVMARFNDDGPYKVGNVKIMLNEENSIEGNLGKISPPTQRTAAAAANKRRIWTRESRAKLAISHLRRDLGPRNERGQFIQDGE